ncbi:hypothetical protein BCR32DRAFT_249874 [Anaeromyces robustus]|uniref:Uncharacterized protein n=1 Tax=Anaeromyces robustus TaxID=1754192 RepID=A0A1Y1WJ65_9FUNG|nr:hypothetical protein BCR32DRAFT_249874 [Anaeromyces robustus]|eukprot:ORX73522.1 hypothetical protein BCR32DRAFT_249874 [Anaeromyces robustus]
MQSSENINPSNVSKEDIKETSMNRTKTVPTATEANINKTLENKAPRLQLNAGKNSEDSSTEMDIEKDVANYFDTMEEDIKDNATIESSTKNSMGGNNQYITHDPTNPAEIFLKATNSAYQTTQTQINVHDDNIKEIVSKLQEEDSARVEHLKQIDEFNKQSASIVENTNAINELKDLFKQMMGSITEIKLNLASKTNTKDVQTFASEVDSRINEINTKKNTQINSLKSELDSIWETRDDDLQKISKTNESVSQLIKDLTQVNKQIDQLNDDIMQFQSDNQLITSEINNEITNKVNQIKSDVNNKISMEQANILNNINVLDRKNSNLTSQFKKFKEQLTLNIEKQTEIQEAIKQYEFDKIIASQQNNEDNITTINQNIQELSKKYNELVIKYGEISKNCKNQNIKNLLKDVTTLKNKLDKLYKEDINKQIEYKLLVTSKPKSKILFEFDFDPATGVTIFKPKKQEYIKIINILINKKLLSNKGKEKMKEEDISIGNLSAFDSDTSFIGSSTINLKLNEKEKKINSKLKSETNSLEDKLNQKIKELSNRIDSLSGKTVQDSDSDSSDTDSYNSFDENFKNEDEKYHYFDTIFQRKKTKNLSAKEFQERITNLGKEILPDPSKGSKNQQFYYYYNNQKQFDPNRTPTIPFLPEEFGEEVEETALQKKSKETFGKIFQSKPPKYTSIDEGYDFLRNLKKYIQDFCPGLSETNIRDAILC